MISVCHQKAHEPRTSLEKQRLRNGPRNMKLRNKAAKGRPPTSHSPLPGRVCVPLEEWKKLDKTSKKFLREAEDGGLLYLAENGGVCAWGAAYKGLFSMDTKAQRDPDGYLITLADAAFPDPNKR